MINTHKLHTAFVNAGATTVGPGWDGPTRMVITTLGDGGHNVEFEWTPGTENPALVFWMLDKMGDAGGRLWNMRMDAEGWHWGGLDHRRDTFKGANITEVATKMFIETFGLR